MRAPLSRFEDHCWKDVVSGDILELYAHYERELFVGPSPALLAVDLYDLVYEGGPLPVRVVSKTHAMSCGEYAWNAIAPTQRLFSAAREAGIPIFYSTVETDPSSQPGAVQATKRRGNPIDPEVYRIKAEFAPQPGDTIVRKMRASVPFGTPLIAHLTQSGVRTLIVCGESTSGCVRATVVDAYSYGFHVVVVEECCFDRNILSHKVNLFDMHHKYADVMSIDDVVSHLEGLRTVAAV